MEYRCRLGTPTGEILEEIHVADSEAHLRHELEQKGYAASSASSPEDCLGRRLAAIGRVRRQVPMREFLVFNQELATLLKAGMPLVQSLDILRERVDALRRSGGPRRRAREGARRARALSDAFGAHGDLFPARLHRVAARRREERQPRRRAAAVRRLHEDHRRREAPDACRR